VKRALKKLIFGRLNEIRMKHEKRFWRDCRTFSQEREKLEVSDEYRDFIDRMISSETGNRPSAVVALEHSCFRDLYECKEEAAKGEGDLCDSKWREMCEGASKRVRSVSVHFSVNNSIHEKFQFKLRQVQRAIYRYAHKNSIR
jgi:serine/threonine protein kinase